MVDLDKLKANIAEAKELLAEGEHLLKNGKGSIVAVVVLEMHLVTLRDNIEGMEKMVDLVAELRSCG